MTEKEILAWRKAVESALDILEKAGRELRHEWDESDDPELLTGLAMVARVMDYLQHQR